MSEARTRPARRGARVHAGATPWTQPQSYVRPAHEPWSDGMKTAAVLGAGVLVFVATGFAQAL